MRRDVQPARGSQASRQVQCTIAAFRHRCFHGAWIAMRHCGNRVEPCDRVLRQLPRGGAKRVAELRSCPGPYDGAAHRRLLQHPTHRHLCRAATKLARDGQQRFHRAPKRPANPLSLRGAQRRSNPPRDEPCYARQAGDCFGAPRLAMTGCSGDSTHSENALTQPLYKTRLRAVPIAVAP